MTMFRMAIPQEHEFLSLSIADSAAWLNEHRNAHDSVLVLLETIDDAVRLFEAGHPFPTLNIGNIHHGPGKRQLTNAVFLSPQEIDGIRRLFERGLKAEIQTLPTETPLDLRRVLEAG
jgi:mannose/fructose/N-acetylgalactosamine-specific phosphotransferase system component IIB